MDEIWKDISGYEGLYQVSNLGRVRSLDRISNGRRLKGALKSNIKDKDGYFKVNLYKDGKLSTQQVHRLVAKSFIPNPDNLPQVNHKDEDKTNNCADNLEWCTNEYNNKYSNVAQKWHQSGIEKSRKAVLQFDLNGTLIAEYESISEAARQIEHPKSVSGISLCCNGKYKTSCGYIWKWKDQN